MEFPSARIDERYRDTVLLPGFVEAHSHAGTGNTWSDTYVGLESRTDPAGNHWPGCSTAADVIDRLRSAESKLADPTEPLLAWGLDPLHLQNQPLAAAELDRVSTTRPIHVLHANAHVCAVNSAALERFGIGPSAQTPGVLKAAARYADWRIAGIRGDGAGGRTQRRRRPLEYQRRSVGELRSGGCEHGNYNPD